MGSTSFEAEIPKLGEKQLPSAASLAGMQVAQQFWSHTHWHSELEVINRHPMGENWETLSD